MIDGTPLLERCSAGLADGAVVAILAAGLAMHFRAGRFVHVALADLVTLGGGAAVGAAMAMDLPARHAVPRSIVLVAIIAGCGALCGGINLAWWRIVFRPLRHETPVLSSLSSIGLSLAAAGLASLNLGSEGRSCAALLPIEGLDPALGRRPNAADVLIVSIAVTALTGVWLIRRRLLPDRAAADPRAPNAASPSEDHFDAIAGSVERSMRWNFLTSGVLAGLAGALLALSSANITAATGPRVGSQALLAAVIAGFGGVRAAVVGGLGIGLLHSFATAFAGDEWSWPGAFVVLLLLIVMVSRVVAVRPSGSRFFPADSPGPIGGRPVYADGGGTAVAPWKPFLAAVRRLRQACVRSRWATWGVFAVLAVLAACVPAAGAPILAVLTAGMLLAALGTGAGWVGLFHLGVFGFFSIGRAVALALATPSLPTQITAVVTAGAAATVVGAGLAACTRRLERATFAIVTFGFSQSVLVALEALRGRGRATGAFPSPTDLPFSDRPAEAGMLLDAGWSSGPGWWPLIGLAMLPVMLGCLGRIWESRMGLCWTAVREDEAAAASLGLSVTWARWGGCVLSASLAGLAGGAQACCGGEALASESLWPATAMLVAGLAIAGSGSLSGGVLAALVLAACGGPWSPTPMRETLPGLQAAFALAFGLGLVAVMRRRPAGLVESDMIVEELRFAGVRPGGPDR